MSTENNPGSEKSLGCPRGRGYIDSPRKREPFFRPGFYKWAPLFIIIICVMLHYFFPGFTSQIIAYGLGEFNQVTSGSFHARGAANTGAPFTQEEIKTAVQEHLLQFGMVDNGTTYDWKHLEYTAPDKLTYEVQAHLTRGTTETCAGTVALDLQHHTTTVTSQLQGL